MSGKRMRYRDLERIVRGFSNHRRIQILDALEKYPKLSVLEISKELKVNFKTIAEHVRRLAAAGLVDKQNVNRDVRHTLTSLGKHTLKFLKELE
ncbi:MAG: winged helix-turn-helix domain-containing protein [Patescibacteria group bacterium]